MTYTLSPNGNSISVGLIGPKKEAQRFGVLANNMFGCSYSDDLFSQVVVFKSEKQFKNLLIWQKYWANYSAGANKGWQTWLKAARHINKKVWPKVQRENFLAHIWHNSGRSYYTEEGA